jgi:hypothetical protein
VTKGFRWTITALVGLIALAGAASLAPRSIPAAPPPVRLEGVVVETEPSPNELVIVPNPSVDLGSENPVVTTTTVPSNAGVVADDDPDPVASPDDPIDPPAQPIDDSAGSADDSAGSSDDD